MRIYVVLAFLLSLSSINAQEKKETEIIGLHILNFSTDNDLALLGSYLPDLKEKGINTIFLEIDYNFDFESHPELSNQNSITKFGAKKLAKQAKKYGVRIIPEFQHIGHQSWKEKTQIFLTTYPNFDLTPGAFPRNDSIYCREWDLTNKAIDTIVFSMVDEIVKAFKADAVHIGADEVFLIGNKLSPSTYGLDPAKLYAEAINRFHHHYSKQNNLEVFMWADRFIDASKYGYGSWEASANGTAPAIDLVPKDIIMCDWHYGNQQSYPSVDLFLEKGFRVLPTSFKDVDAAKSFIKYSYSKKNPNMLGHMFTMWGTVKKEDILSFKAMNEGAVVIQEKRFNDVFIDAKGIDNENNLIVELRTVDPELDIFYSLNGNNPTTKSIKYVGPILLNKSSEITAKAFRGEKEAGDIAFKDFIYHKAIGAKIILKSKPSEDYGPMNKETLLVNGIALTTGYGNGEWLGYNGNDMDVVVDFEKKCFVKEVSMNFNNSVNSWIHHPREVIVYGSNDGEQFSQIAYKKKRSTGRTVVNIKLVLEKPEKFRYIQVVAKNQLIPDGFNGEGNAAWIFVDEIVVK